MKKSLIVLFALFIAVSVNAQNINLSVGGELSMPMGTFGDAAGIGFGGTVRGEYPILRMLVI